MSTAATRNPFRSPAVSPNPTGAPSIFIRTSSPRPAGPDQQDGLFDLPDEAPPAYSPTANVYSGEAVIEYGPRRPFQPAPPPRLFPQESGRPQQSASSSRGNAPGFPPPPIHPMSRSASNPERPRGPVSDFARDFYASGEAPSATQYSPPSQAPPVHSSSSTFSRGDGEALQTNNRPTSTPTPGRPLLHNGSVLIYDSGFICRKCVNSGYKNYDPEQPCKKCWKRYSKPYAGPLAYAPWDSSPRSNMQHPLPSFRPPQAPRSLSPSRYATSPAPRSPQHSSSSSFPNTNNHTGTNGGYPGSLNRQAYPPPTAPPFQVGWTPHAPQGAAVVRPGDPRIGGRLCWKCGGDGTISFLIFDTEQCPVCAGLGRVFP